MLRREKLADCLAPGILQLLQLVRGLRAAGIFVAVAVTQPFVFEGPKKRQAAEGLIAQLHNTAHLVAVVDQVRPVASNLQLPCA